MGVATFSTPPQHPQAPMLTSQTFRKRQCTHPMGAGVGADGGWSCLHPMALIDTAADGGHKWNFYFPNCGRCPRSFCECCVCMQSWCAIRMSAMRSFCRRVVGLCFFVWRWIFDGVWEKILCVFSVRRELWFVKRIWNSSKSIWVFEWKFNRLIKSFTPRNTFE